MLEVRALHRAAVGREDREVALIRADLRDLTANTKPKSSPAFRLLTFRTKNSPPRKSVPTMLQHA